jgi:hypothetical protein
VIFGFFLYTLLSINVNNIILLHPIDKEKKYRSAFAALPGVGNNFVLIGVKTMFGAFPASCIWTGKMGRIGSLKFFK